jgi:hypothetical protein
MTMSRVPPIWPSKLGMIMETFLLMETKTPIRGKSLH